MAKKPRKSPAEARLERMQKNIIEAQRLLNQTLFALLLREVPVFESSYPLFG